MKDVLPWCRWPQTGDVARQVGVAQHAEQVLLTDAHHRRVRVAHLHALRLQRRDDGLLQRLRVFVHDQRLGAFAVHLLGRWVVLLVLGEHDGRLRVVLLLLDVHRAGALGVARVCLTLSLFHPRVVLSSRVRKVEGQEGQEVATKEKKSRGHLAHEKKCSVCAIVRGCEIDPGRSRSNPRTSASRVPHPGPRRCLRRCRRPARGRRSFRTRRTCPWRPRVNRPRCTNPKRRGPSLERPGDCAPALSFPALDRGSPRSRSLARSSARGEPGDPLVPCPRSTTRGVVRCRRPQAETSL